MASRKGIVLVDRFRVGDEIGRGMSVVHEARDLLSGERVAIKLMDASAGPVEAERLYREYKVGEEASHPVMVKVWAYGTDEIYGLDFLVMELLEGEDLSKRIGALGALPARFVVRLGVKIADALAHVHAMHIIHRDLKPANIYLSNERGLRDQVRLLDFGFSKHQKRTLLTAPDESLGTPLYMAPEQLRSVAEVSELSDIFALGVVLRECLLGEPPEAPRRDELRVESIRRLIESRRVPLRRLRPDFPPRLCEVVDRCMQLQPEARYPSARALCDALLALPGLAPRSVID